MSVNISLKSSLVKVRKRFTVVDGKKGKQYVSIITIGGGKTVFHAPDSLHYLTLKEDDGIYLVSGKTK